MEDTEMYGPEDAETNESAAAEDAPLEGEESGGQGTEL